MRVYLNLDPDNVKAEGLPISDVRQIGHFGTGDLEITIKTKKDIDAVADFLKASYELAGAASGKVIAEGPLWPLRRYLTRTP